MGNYFFDNPQPFYLDRVDGKAKVTGAAKYSAEYDFPNLAYAVLVGSTIARGSIQSMDTKAAENAPGVLAVINHLNIPILPGYKLADNAASQPDIRKGYKIFSDDLVRFYGQPIAMVVADTFERATHAATLIKTNYKKDESHTDIFEAMKTGKPVEGDRYKDNIRGEADAWKNAEIKIEAEYRMPIEVHLPMEIHATTAVWDGPDKITVYDKTQGLRNTQQNIMRVFGLKEENVRVICQFVGGAFGSAGNTWPHTIATVIAAKQTKRPVKLMLTRSQMFTCVGYRPQAIQKISIGASKDGKLVGITHEAMAITASYQEFSEGIVNGSRGLYNCPNVTTRYKLYPLDLSLPTFMRGPGETTGAFGLESAMDEMAYALNLDPLEFRLRNYAEKDPENGRPYSSKFLKEAYQLGAEKIKWNERKMVPGTLKEGEWLAGYGTGTGIFAARRGEAKVGARFEADGTLVLQSGVTDMGDGTATAMTQLASEVFGIDPKKIRFELGDTNLPPGPMQVGSTTTSTLGTTINNACVTLKSKMVELIKNNSIFHTELIHSVKPEDVIFQNGFIMLASDRSKKISYTDVLKDANLSQIEFIEESKANDEMRKYSAFSYAVSFIKVLVHPMTGIVKVVKAVSAVDAGKIVNFKTAESQMIGAVVGGISMSLMEEGVIDHRYGKWVNNNFADYHVAVNADIPKIEVFFVDKPDPILNPQGSKGIGEVGIVGLAPAVCNAVFNATGKRIRELPITPDKLI